MNNVPIGYYSMKILKEPSEKGKGAIILSQVDNVVEKMPFIKEKFYIIERRGWRGLNESKHADIKLVEDLSFWDETLKIFPHCICLDIGPADFIDTDSFKPISIKKEYECIQISQWSDFKKAGMLIKAAALIPEVKFLKLGHFAEGGTPQEIELRDSAIELSRETGASIDFPFSDAKSNHQLPDSKEEINNYINKAKIGILTSKIEGINRFKMECLSANIPVLVPNDACTPLKKHINEYTGELFDPTPEGLATAIKKMLNNIDTYCPRKYILENTGKSKSIAKLKNALMQLCIRDKSQYTFDNIDWDGRNQSLSWGDEALRHLQRYSG